ncbi:MAG: hypothetical protein PHF00_05665, partial [Elusimicrobia bacterium]|nr:hypothetical protein [Elusimicrobiota bacterium]
VAINAGTLDLLGSTLAVRGSWTPAPGTLVRGGSSTVVFDGAGPAPQRVALRAGSSFYNLISSAAAALVVQSPLEVARNMELHRGTLQISSRAVTVGGDLLRPGAASLLARGSTVTLSGAQMQSLAFGSLDTLVADGPGGARLTGDMTISNRFAVPSGRAFDGGGRVLTITGSNFETAGADYTASAPGHAVVLNPASGSARAAAGSKVNGGLTVAAGRALVLDGDLELSGFGSVLNVQTGGSVVNAAGGSTITFRDTADLAPSAGRNWTYGGAAGASWLVFTGTGTARGASMSSNTLGNLRVNLAGDTSTFQHPDLALTGSVVVESGVFKPAGGATLSLGGDFLQTGGEIDYVCAGTGTVRFAGPYAQRIALRPGHSLEAFRVDSGTAAVAQSDLNIRGDFRVSSGVFQAGSFFHRLGGRFRVEPGGPQFRAQASTWTLDGDAWQDVSLPAGGAFHGLTVAVSSALLGVSFSADVLTDRVAGGTLVFVSGQNFSVGELRLAGGAGPAGRLRLRPATEGAPFSMSLLGVSSVTAVDVSSCDASGGLVIHANDGSSLDSGGNSNWNFKPSLKVMAPGPQQAGTPFPIAVRAVDASGNPVPGVAFPVALSWTENYVSTPAALNLVDGATIFSNVVLRTAQTVSIYPQASAQAFSTEGAQAVVGPGPLSRLQVLMPGEAPLPGSAAGKTGLLELIAADKPFSAQVRGTDSFWNLVPGAADDVELSTAAPLPGNLPQRATLSAGATVFSFVVLTASAASVALTAADLSDPGGVQSDVGTPTSVFAASPYSPSVSIAVPAYATLVTLGGALTGTAADDVAISRVIVAVQRKDSGLFYSWSPPAFDSPEPVYSLAEAAPHLGRSVSWRVALADAVLADRTSYYVLAVATNPSDHLTVAQTTFTFLPSALAAGDPGDGEGTAAALTPATAGCQVLTATVIFTAGGRGVAAGGAVAVHLPDGWTRPEAWSDADPPAAPGSLHVGATTAFAVDFNPPQADSATLGDNWVLFRPLAPLTPGQRIFLTFRALPAASAAPFDFAVMSRGGPAGRLKALADSPRLSLPPGPPARLAFAPPAPFVLGPLQTAPTMELRLTDACGASTVAAANFGVSISAGRFDEADRTAVFYAAGGALLPSSRVSFLVNQSSGDAKFYFRTSTTGVSFELVMATASIPGVGLVSASRFAALPASSPSFASVSADAGTPEPGSKSASIAVPGGQAFVNFVPSDPALRWTATVSSCGATFFPPWFQRSGAGAPGRELSWNGFDESVFPARLAGPATYFVRLEFEGGAGRDDSLRLAVAPSPSIFGDLGPGGARARVRAYGPGAGPGSFAVASATGYFQIFGLRAGAAYGIEASTVVWLQSRPLELSVSSAGVAAATGGADAGALAFPTPGVARVSAALPIAAARELWGRATLRDASGAARDQATVHFASMSAASDDGARAVGADASSWTVLGAAPGVYALELELAGIGFSTRVEGVALAAGAVTDIAASLPRKAAVAGNVILPSTTAFGAWVSVEARLNGSSSAVLTGALVPGAASGPPPGPLSAPYALYGLEPGSWTLTARAQGFAAASRAEVLGSTDSRFGFDLALGAGGVIRGTATVLGDTRGRSDSGPGSWPGPGFSLLVTAFNAATLAQSSAKVLLATGAAAVSSTFTLGGLEDGVYLVAAELDGFEAARRTVVVAGGAGEADLALRGPDARLRLALRLPAGRQPAVDAGKTSLLLRGPSSAAVLRQDLTAGATTQFFASSATVLLGPFAPGTYVADVLFGPTGAWASSGTLLRQGATAYLELDLAGATTTLRGAVALGGGLVVSSADFSVEVSSMAGLLALSPTTGYCLMGSTAPVSLPALHMELLPVRPREGQSSFLEGPLPAAPPGGCSTAALSVSGLAPNSAHAYAAAISADGSFAFSNLPWGDYWLRLAGGLDGLLADGGALSAAGRAVRVSSATPPAFVRLDPGGAVCGDLILPAQTRASRSFLVALRDASGAAARQATVTLNDSDRAAYRLGGVAAGDYVLTVTDLGWPTRYAASPRALTASGLFQPGQDLALSRTGVITGRLAVETFGLDGGRQFAAAGASNPDLLPRELRIEARADPYFPGGLAAARRTQDGVLALDESDRFVIEGLLPGLYHVRAAAAGSSLAPADIPAVEVREGGVSDVGVMNLPSAARLRGRVVDAGSGAGLAGVPVEARPSLRRGYEDAAAAAWTDSSGAFVLAGLDPRVRLYDIAAAGRGRALAADALPPYESRVLYSVDVGSVPEIALRPAPYYIRGRLSAPPGGPPLALPFGAGAGPAPGAVVLLQRWRDIPSENPVADSQAQSDAQGYFFIPALAAGTYQLTAAAQGYAPLKRVVAIFAAPVDLGELSLTAGAALSGRLLKPGGAAPAAGDVRSVAAVTEDLSEVLFGAVELEPISGSVSGYRIDGLRAGVPYRLIVVGGAGEIISPEAGRSVTLAGAGESRWLDLVLRPEAPAVAARARRVGEEFELLFEFSQPLRRRLACDDDLELLLSTAGASGALSRRELSDDRRQLRAAYAPAFGASESSFTVRLRGYSAVADPDGADPANPEFAFVSTAAFFSGVDGLSRGRVPNYSGGNLAVDGDAGRVSLPPGVFRVEASSCVEVALQVSREPLAGGWGAAAGGGLAAMRRPPAAYPAGLLRALAAAPPEVRPLSAFYDVGLAPGARADLARPAQLSLAYSTGVDPAKLNVYWYNAAANAYILQQDVTGAPAAVDAGNRTITTSVNHFSTFGLFEAG